MVYRFLGVRQEIQVVAKSERVCCDLPTRQVPKPRIGQIDWCLKLYLKRPSISTYFRGTRGGVCILTPTPFVWDLRFDPASSVGGELASS